MTVAVFVFVVSNLITYYVLRRCQAQEKMGKLKVSSLAIVIIAVAIFAGLNIGTLLTLYIIGAKGFR